MPVSQSAAVTRLRCMTVPVAARVVSMAAVSFPAVLYRRDVVTFSDPGGLRMKTVMLGVLLWQVTTADGRLPEPIALCSKVVQA